MLFKTIGSYSRDHDEKLKRKFLDAVCTETEYSEPWPLPNMRERTEIDFWSHRASYSFVAEAYFGQKKILGEWATVLVYYLGHGAYEGGGFAVAYFHRHGHERAQYYSWRRCDHEFRHKSTGNCQHLYTCEKCGYSYDVDSSG